MIRSKTVAPICGILLAGILLLFPSHAVTASNENLEKVILQLRWFHQFQFAGYYAALDQGYYRDAGLDVIIKEAKTGLDTTKEVIDGKAQYGISGSNILLKRNKDLPVVAMAAIFQHSPLILLSNTETDILSPQDLVGRRVMIRTADEVQTRAMILNEGIALDEIDFIEHTYNYDDLIDGKVDAATAFITSQPFLLEERGISYSFLRPRSYGIDFYGDCLFTSEEEIKNHPDRAKAFWDASLKGWAYAMDHQEELIELIKKDYKSKVSSPRLRYEAESMENIILPQLVEIGHMNPGRWRHIARTYVKLGMLDPDYSLEGFIYNPNPIPDYTWLKWFVGITSASILLVSAAVCILFLFNRNLSKEIDERKQAEEALQESEDKFRNIAENSLVGIYIIQDDIFTYLNPEFAEIFGYSVEEILNKMHFQQLVHPEDLNIVQENVHSRLSGKTKSIRYAFRGIRKDGITIHVEIFGSSILLNEKAAATGTMLDITARKESEAERLSLERRLQQADKAENLSRMAGAVAHHFNNMLAATIGNLELVMEDLPPGTNLSQNLAATQKATQRAAEMSGLLLTYLGQSQGKPEPHDLSENCKDQLVQLRTDLPEGVELKTDLPVPGPVIKADIAQMRQVLSALFANAWEALEDSSGRVQVSVERVKAAEIQEDHRIPADWALSADEYACLAVGDTGRGMDAATIDRIFDPFYTDKFTGRGLGLAVVLGIVKAHGGGIMVESKPGRGSVFRVYLPLTAEPVPLPKAKEPETSATLEGGLVLLIEDEEAVRKVTKALLERSGFEVLIARDGVEGVEIFRENQENIVLVLSDLTMPRMDGWKTIAALRAIRPDIAVILASGYDEAQAMSGDHEEQPHAFLPKPFNMKTFKETLERVLAGN